ncbi:MAG: hypothetical protein ACREOU_01270 [Candidatus Eiseniibacteriota bacterium]
MAALALAIALFGALFPPAAVAAPAPAVDAPDPPAGPAFGDSGWVAPIPADSLAGDPTKPGPRVAPRDHEPLGETILRTPFRILFLPLRVVALGLEEVAGLAEPYVAPSTMPREPKDWRITPLFTISGSAGPGVGVGIRRSIDPQHDAAVSLAGGWSLHDTRRVRLRANWGNPHDVPGFALGGDYAFRPNRKFYGIGNFSNANDQSIFLEESGALRLAILFGRRADRQFRLLGGVGTTSARRGYNGSPGVLDVFPEDQVPFMLDATQIYSYGVGADLASVDDMRDPSVGVHARAEVEEVRSFNDSEINFRRWHLEARAYVPVFSKRRVLAFRGLHQIVDPSGDPSTIPFYYLPESSDDGRFAAYKAHRFSDRHLLIGHAEYRWRIWDRLWALAQAEIAEVAGASDQIRIADVHESYGGGLRYAMTDRSMARLSIASGAEGLVIFISLKEDF